jgi:hypothetical protein
MLRAGLVKNYYKSYDEDMLVLRMADAGSEFLPSIATGPGTQPARTCQVVIFPSTKYMLQYCHTRSYAECALLLPIEQLHIQTAGKFHLR